MNFIQQCEYAKVGFGIAAIMAFIAIFEMPSGYYMVLRWVLFISFIAMFWALENVDMDGLGFLYFIPVLIGLAMFNPFIIMTNDKSTWVIIDIVAAIMFAHAAYGSEKSRVFELKMLEKNKKQKIHA